MEVKSPTKLKLELNRGLRTLLGWYRDYTRGRYKAQILKSATASDEIVLESIAKKMILTNGPQEVSFHASGVGCRDFWLPQSSVYFSYVLL